MSLSLFVVSSIVDVVAKFKVAKLPLHFWIFFIDEFCKLCAVLFKLVSHCREVVVLVRLILLLIVAPKLVLHLAKLSCIFVVVVFFEVFQALLSPRQSLQPFVGSWASPQALRPSDWKSFLFSYSRTSLKLRKLTPGKVAGTPPETCPAEGLSSFSAPIA